MKILITGGSGFVGSQLATRFKEHLSDCDIVVLDNLRRRGSELNLALFNRLGIRFVHGDIRHRSDLDSLHQDFDLFIEASAEPSVQAGVAGDPDYVLQTNLGGTLNCLNFARQHAEKLLFLSTSRVYSIAPLRAISLTETESRFQLAPEQSLPGVSSLGISEDFPTHLSRSLYGATKLASEMFVQEFVDLYGLKALVYRCGVIAGPGQFGRVDQGVFTLWVANHYFKRKLEYTGFGGTGKQVRDLLHPADLFDLLVEQLPRFDDFSGQIFNVGGGLGLSVSLVELTGLCQEVTGNRIPLSSRPETHPVDVPLYISDCSRLERHLKWRAKRDVQTIVTDIFQWIGSNERQLKDVFA